MPLNNAEAAPVIAVSSVSQFAPKKKTALGLPPRPVIDWEPVELGTVIVPACHDALVESGAAVATDVALAVAFAVSETKNV